MQITNLQDKIDYFDNKCPVHKKYNLNTILVQKQVESNLVCFKCAQEKNIPYSDIINVVEITNLSEDDIIPNFPPLQDKNLYQFLNSLESQQVKIDKIIENINEFFEQFKTQFLSIIQQMQAQTKQKLTTLIDLKQKIKDIYNEISSKESFQKILIDNQNDIQQQIKLVIEDKFQNIKLNTQKIKEQVDEYELKLKSFNLVGSQEILEVVLNMVEKIDLFKEIDILELINDHLKKKQQLKNQQSTVDLLQELIKNSTNYCSQQFLNQIYQTFSKYQHIFNKIKFTDQAFEKEKKNIFSNLNTNQIQDISNIVQCIQRIDKQYTNNAQKTNKLSKQIQFNSQCIIDYLSDKYDVNQQKLEILLRKYPILESLPKFNENQIQQKAFIKSKNYEDSQSLQVLRININSNIQISKFSHDSFGVSYANFILDDNKKYIIRLKILMHQKCNPSLFIGILDDRYKDHVQLHNNGLSYSENGLYKGITKVIKGKQVHSENENVYKGSLVQLFKENLYKEIEMRIHLDQKILKVADFPNYNNIAELEDKQKIEASSNYRFAIELVNSEDQIIVTCISVVDEFDKNM